MIEYSSFLHLTSRRSGPSERRGLRIERIKAHNLCIMQQSKQSRCDDGQEDEAHSEGVDKGRSEIIEAIFAREVAGQENFQTIESH
jgi:hypothetical protein